ncbi:hypothetical protein [Desulfohalovibrio reitneri]|uniref:hypothetical protein n=1 Tax=Desulfohalovibrio reitneri TaxID=1307759 RepID=UPI0004A6E28B|nr:hypothetical protein [Desulfohalovibrio reitneri]
MLHVRVEPETEAHEMHGVRTVRKLLNVLNLRETDALVIRGDELLTSDRHLDNGDEILVRPVRSRG